MTARFSLFAAFASVLTLGLGCQQDEASELDVDLDEEVAMDAAIKSLDGVREDLPVEDESLEVLARDFIDLSRDDLTCEREGVVSGVWYDADLRPVFEGSWFKLGTGELGGTITGSYGDGAYNGTAEGPGLTAEVVGVYEDGRFVGAWDSVNEDGGTDDGELVGQYERRNEHGGYFFGLWGDCSRVTETDPDGSTAG